MMKRWKAAVAGARWRELPSRRQFCAFAGTACLIFGTWAPVMEVPILGEIAYAQYAQGESWILLALAVVAVLATALERFRVLWFAGAGSLAVLLVTAARMAVTLTDEEDTAQPLIQVMLHAMQVQWGWIPLVLGAVLLLVAAAGPRLLVQEAAQSPSF